MKKTNYRVELHPKTPNPGLHDRRDPRSYLGDPDPDEPTDALWQLFFTVISDHPPVNPSKNTPQTQTSKNQSTP
jgi:hypothetical protein